MWPVREFGAASTESPMAAPSTTPKVIWPKVFRVIPAPRIPDSAIDSHIPSGTNNADRDIVHAVMVALPPSIRQNIMWVHSPGGAEYWKLPNRDLVMVYCSDCSRDHYTNASQLPGLYVLFVDGKVDLDSNLTFNLQLDRHFFPVPSSFSSEVLCGECVPK